MAAVVPVLVIGAASVASVQEALADQSAKDGQALAQTTGGLILDRMNQLIGAAETIAADSSLKWALVNTSNPGYVATALEGVAANQSTFLALGAAWGNGTMAGHWPAQENWIMSDEVQDQPFIIGLADNGAGPAGASIPTYVGGVYRAFGDRDPAYIPVATVVRDNLDHVRGILVGFAPASAFDGLLNPLATDSRAALLYDSRGAVISRSEHDGAQAITNPSDLQGVNAALTSQTSGSLRTSGGDTQVLGFSPIFKGTTSWVLVVREPLSAVLSQAAPILYLSLLIVVVTGLAAAVTARVLSGRTVEPVEALTKAAKDLDQAQQLPAAMLDRRDELGTLARSFQTMAQRVQLEAAAKEALIVRLRELDRLKTSIIDTVSHELRTPITIIRGTAEILQTAATKEDARLSKGTARIIQSSDALAYIVDELLELSQIQAGTAELNRAPTNVNEVLRACAELEAETAKRAGVNINLALDDATGEILADRPKVRIVFRNLISNGVKFSKPGGTVSISSLKDDGGVMVRVEDRGIGIPQENIEQIFNPFSQADGSVTRARGGAGIGLAIVKGFTEMHGGRVDVKSKQGEGSVFSLWLPAAPPGQAN